MKRAGVENDSVPRVKRSKASCACDTCRKSKTRCEVLDELPRSAQCHRCKVLRLVCSFESKESSNCPPENITSPQLDEVVQAKAAETQAPTSGITFMPDAPAPTPLSWTVHKVGVNDLNDFSVAFASGSMTNTLQLVPTLSHPWSCFGPRDNDDDVPDWSVAPILVIRDMTKSVSQTIMSYPSTDYSLEDIISIDQIGFLLDTFENIYAGWLNLPPVMSGHDSRLLNLVKCTIASRHLDHEVRVVVAPRIDALAEQSLLQQIFIPSIELIHAILILSLWTPICSGPTPAVTRDTRLLAASGVNLASSLKLQGSAKLSHKLKLELARDQFNPTLSAEWNEATNNARLWLALGNVESMLCLGTGRTTTSIRTEADCNFITVNTDFCIGIRLPTTPPEHDYDVHEYSPQSPLPRARDVRIGLLANLYYLTEQGLNLSLESMGDLGSFLYKVEETFQKLYVLQRIIHTLPFVSAHETVHFQMLELHYFCVHLLFIHHILRQAKLNIRPHWQLALYHGQPFVGTWTKHAITFCDRIITTVLSLPASSLSSAPDSLFHFITFAACLLVVSKFTIWDEDKKHLSGYDDTLILMLQKRLEAAALSDDHTPRKSANIVKALLDSWQTHVRLYEEAVQRQISPSYDSPESSGESSFVHTPPAADAGQDDSPYLSTPFYNVKSNAPIGIPSMENLFDGDFFETFMTQLSQTAQTTSAL